MKNYYWKFISSVLTIGIFPCVLLIMFVKMYFGVMDPYDNIMAGIMMTVGTLAIIRDELQNIIQLKYEKRIKNLDKYHMSAKNDSNKQTCPECKGYGMVEWSTNEEPLTCWKCSGTGKV